MMRTRGAKSARLDILYGDCGTRKRKAFDLCTDAGFAYLVFNTFGIQ